MTSESKGFQLILRLTRATVDKAIKWKILDAPRTLTAGTDDFISFYIETSFKGQRIALFERRSKDYDGERDSFYWTGYAAIALLDADRRVVWEFGENSSALENLLKVARESAANVETILDSLLS